MQTALRLFPRVLPRRTHHTLLPPLVYLLQRLVPVRSFASFTVVVPSLGDSITEGTIVEVTKKEGDSVDTDEVIGRLETDKVTVDLRSASRGTITAVKHRQGDTVHPGDVILEGDDSASGAPTPAPAQRTAERPKDAPPQPKTEPIPPPPSPTRMQAIDSHEQPRAHQPLIAFRYGKGRTASAHAEASPPSAQRSPATPEAASKAASASKSAVSAVDMSRAVYFGGEGWREANEAAERARRSLPRSYIRSPRLSEVEQELIMMGGAAPYTPKSLQQALEAKKPDKPAKKK